MKVSVKSLGSCVAVLAVLAVRDAAAETKYGTGSFFHEHCQAILDNDNSKELYRQGECSGILGTMSYFSEQLPKQHRFCSPADVTGAQLAKVLVTYMDQHKNDWDSHITMLAAQAFRAEWPCKS